MRLFLVRHGESVDNVAGLYAGSRDSPLTSHGVLQTRRLGAHFASARIPDIGPVSHIFASDLQRAARTAEAILEAHPPVDGSCAAAGVVRLPELRERDFGSAEGKKYMAQPKNDPHPDAESYASMDARVARFMDERLRPLVETGMGKLNVVVVGHGIILNVLLRAILLQYAPAELTRLSPGWSTSGQRVEWLASFHNTAYLEAHFSHGSQASHRSVGEAPPHVVHERGPVVGLQGESVAKQGGKADISLTVIAVNCQKHLEGLKKTRGGIGSAKFDEKQKTVDSFFKPAPKT